MLYSNVLNGIANSFSPILRNPPNNTMAYATCPLGFSRVEFTHTGTTPSLHGAHPYKTFSVQIHARPARHAYRSRVSLLSRFGCCVHVFVFRESFAHKVDVFPQH